MPCMYITSTHVSAKVKTQISKRFLGKMQECMESMTAEERKKGRTRQSMREFSRRPARGPAEIARKNPKVSGGVYEQQFVRTEIH